MYWMPYRRIVRAFARNRANSAQRALTLPATGLDAAHPATQRRVQFLLQQNILHQRPDGRYYIDPYARTRLWRARILTATAAGSCLVAGMLLALVTV